MTAALIFLLGVAAGSYGSLRVVARYREENGWLRGHAEDCYTLVDQLDTVAEHKARWRDLAYAAMRRART